jgi:hypothetical protein
MPETTLTREQLYEQIWSQPLSTLAHIYMRTEMSLRTLCIEMSIPVPRDGHWEKIKAGKQINTPPLSTNYQGSGTVTLPIREPKKTKEKEEKNAPAKPVITSQVEPKKGIVMEQKAFKPMTATISNLPTDKLVISAGKTLQKMIKEGTLHDGKVFSSSWQGEIGISVSPELVDRALTFMSTLIKALRVRGHDIIVKSNATCVVVFQQELKIHCRERTKRITVNEQFVTYRFRPSGLLALKLDGLYGREWVDGVTKFIDDQIPSMIDKFEEEGRRKIEWAASAEKSRLEREEKARIEKERQQNHDRELSASRNLLQRALRWEKSLALRRYINELETRALKETLLPEDLQQYLAWARKKADWYDPFINAVDEFLGDADKEMIEQPAEKKTSGFGSGGFGSSGNDSYYPGQKSWFHP